MRKGSIHFAGFGAAPAGSTADTVSLPESEALPLVATLNLS